jgi:hypothetical protein
LREANSIGFWKCKPRRRRISSGNCWTGPRAIIEWQATRNVNGVRFDWRGVDKFRLRQGKIIEEQVYTDTAPLPAFRKGETLEPITQF